jgi:hypothetical protein
MARNSRYWLLAYRDLASPWGVAFADADRKAVLGERQHMRDRGTEASRLRVIGLPDDRQATVDAAIAELNRPWQANYRTLDGRWVRIAED